MSIVINLTEQQHEDLIVTALEGGIGYWCHIGVSAHTIVDAMTPIKLKKEPFSIRFWQAIKAGAIIPIHDTDDRKKQLGEISLKSIDKGEQLLADKHPRHLFDLLSPGEWDQITADVWFQYCSLGKIVYG